MKFTGTIDEDGNVAIPAEIVEGLRLKPGERIDMEIGESAARPVFDQEAFDAAVEKYAGSMRQQMLDDGYSSVDEMMEDVRPQW